ncbi:MAG: hypothetical protein WBO09_15345, partial [Methylocystis silviterrae]|uniref:hypothetical protein n=1 Tax=Methylocystis silviterrae TaxID=2743612 RepID=UPI003C7381EB
MFQIFVALPYVIADRVAIMRTVLFFSKFDIVSSVLYLMNLRFNSAVEFMISIEGDILSTRDAPTLCTRDGVVRVARDVRIRVQRRLDSAPHISRAARSASRKPAAARPLPADGTSRRHARLIRAVAALQRGIAFGDERLFRRRAVAQRLALFVECEESRLADAFPFGGALAR